MADCSVSNTSVFAIIGWVITGLGWYVTSVQANRREIRKELRSQIDSLIEAIEATQEVAQEYYSNKDDERQKNRLQLFPKFQKIETKISLLTSHKKDFKVDGSFSAFWEAITDGDFDSIQLKKLDTSDVRFSRISSSSSTLILEIETWYLNSNR